MGQTPEESMSEDQLVSWRLKQLEESVARMETKLDSLNTDAAILKSKAGSLGGLLGMLGGLAASFLFKAFVGDK